MTDFELAAGSAFFFLYSGSTIIIGFIVNHIATSWVLFSVALIWPFVQFRWFGITTLLNCRIISGAGERPVFLDCSPRHIQMTRSAPR